MPQTAIGYMTRSKAAAQAILIQKPDPSSSQFDSSPKAMINDRKGIRPDRVKDEVHKKGEALK